MPTITATDLARHTRQILDCLPAKARPLWSNATRP